VEAESDGGAKQGSLSPRPGKTVKRINFNPDCQADRQVCADRQQIMRRQSHRLLSLAAVAFGALLHF